MKFGTFFKRTRNLVIFFSGLALIICYVSGIFLIKSFTAHHNFLVPRVKKTPADASLIYSELSVSYDNKKFIGWFVPASINTDSVSNVVMIFVGRGQGISDWVNVQKLLYQNRISSFVFNYGDLKDTVLNHNDKSGKSSTSFSEMEYIIPKFFDQLKKNTRRGSRFFLLGHSIGCAVITEFYSLLDTNYLRGIVLCSPFASLRKFSAQHGTPKLLLFVIPKNIFNNEHNIIKMKKQVLFVHSKSDSVNYYAQGLEVFLNACEPKKFISYDNFDHNYIINARNDFWQAIIDFIKTG